MQQTYPNQQIEEKGLKPNTDLSDKSRNRNLDPGMFDGTQKCAGTRGNPCTVVAGWPILQACPTLQDEPRCKYCRQDHTDRMYGAGMR